MLDDTRLPLISFTGSVSVGTRRGARPSASAWAAPSSNWAATTASSWPRTPTWTWRCAPSSSARWARPASAARRRGASSCTKSIAAELTERLVQRLRSRCPSAIRWTPSTLMGPLVDGGAVDDMMAAIETATGPGRRRFSPAATSCREGRRLLRRADHHQHAPADAHGLRGDLCADSLPDGIRRP